MVPEVRRPHEAPPLVVCKLRAQRGYERLRGADMVHGAVLAKSIESSVHLHLGGTSEVQYTVHRRYIG
eukprot:5818603-Pyramimonas_sp.AAC.2